MAKKEAASAPEPQEEQVAKEPDWTPPPPKSPPPPAAVVSPEIPTPEIGMTVNHYAQVDEREPPVISAAIVTGIEGPGVVILTRFPHNGDPRSNVFGVTWRHDKSKPGHQRRERGTWDYVPGTPVNDDRFALHRRFVAKMRAQLGR